MGTTRLKKDDTVRIGKDAGTVIIDGALQASGDITLSAGGELVFDESVSNDAGIRSDSSGHLYLRTHATNSTIILEAGNPEATVVTVRGTNVEFAKPIICGNSAANFDIVRETSDASDTKFIRVGGGGAIGIGRGGDIRVYGQDHATLGGNAEMQSATGGEVLLKYTTTVRIEIDSTGIGLYGSTPVAQASAIGKLTNSTGGTANTTLAAVSGTAADATINDNFSDINAKLDSIIDALGNTSGIGITAD